MNRSSPARSNLPTESANTRARIAAATLRPFRRWLAEVTRHPMLHWLVPEETVSVLQPDGQTRLWHRGGPIGPAPADSPPQAVMLPDALCLQLDCRLPLLGPEDLDAAISLKAESICPFDAADRVLGWHTRPLPDGQLAVRIGMASRRQIEAHLLRHASAIHKHDATPEVWIEGTPPIVLKGYGEAARLTRQSRQRRLIGGLLVLNLALATTLMITPALQGRQILQDARHQLASLQAETRPVLAERERLVALQTRISAVHEVLPVQADLPYLLEQLTEILPDSVYLLRFEAGGGQVRISGLADNAARLVDTLGTHALFSSVRTPAPISRNREGLESFTVEMSLNPEAAVRAGGRSGTTAEVTP